MKRIACYLLILPVFSIVFGGMLTVAYAQNTTSGGTGLSTDDIIQQILVDGAERVEPGTVKSYMVVREGDRFNPARIDKSLKSLFATGLFADVTLTRNNNVLVVSVVENPIINRIAFEGNFETTNETLSGEVTLRPRVIYTRTKVQNDVERILTVYRRSGRFAATVEPKIIQLPQNRVDLVFEIREGDPTEIASVKFVGNKEFDDSALRDIIRTKETIWYRILGNDDNYDPDRMTLDRELLRRFYLSEGFADFRVLSANAELSPNQKDFFITFTVDEGERYQFGEITLNPRIRNLKTEDLAGIIDYESGDWFDNSVIEKTIDKVTQRTGELGFPFIDVRPRIKRDRETKKINLTFEVNEGPRVFVERIDISGNVRTLDKVIRREFRLVEGDAFNASKLRRSRRRLRALDFFEKVNVERQPGSTPDKSVIKVEVEEKSTGSISVGAGYSTASGPLGEVTLSEKNLLGKGQEVNLKLTIAAKQSQVDLGLTEPYFLDREIRAGVDVFHVEQDLQDSSSLDTKTTGFGFRAGYPLTEDLQQSWNYTFKRQQVTDVGSSASSLIKSAEGIEYSSQIGHVIAYDKLDNRNNPKEGYIVKLKTDLAGLGGSNKYIRNTLSASQFWPVTDDVTLSFKAKTGLITGITKDVRFLDRYFIGGDDLRGFETNGVGPRDTLTDDALGGEWKYTGSISIQYPIGLPKELGISGRTFTDFGSSGSLSPTNSTTKDDGSLRVSAGAGITWVSPFGPIGFDLAFPLLKEDYDLEENFRLNFATRF